MKIYFSGIGGVGIGPLAEIASDAGYRVVGSDMAEGLMTRQLEDRGVKVYLSQDGSSLESEHQAQAIDWFVHTSALKNDHPELQKARSLGIKTAKRDELIAKIVQDKNLKMIAIAGTHGKTTTTGLMVWAMKQLGLPVSYLVGTTLSFGPSGFFDPESQYFVYECDEFDRNFLNFEPELSLITALDYDHPDTFPTLEDYQQAFVDFLSQSGHSLIWQKDLHFLKQPDIEATYDSFDDLKDLSYIKLPGNHTRQNAFLVEQALRRIDTSANEDLVAAINSFPGTDRRFEKIADNLYSDYGHHPNEIAATLQLASELADKVVLVYQPHQNTRQHEVKNLYDEAVFEKATQIYWLPTYLSRENPDLPVLTPQELTTKLQPSNKLQTADLDDNLWQQITKHLEQGHLVLCMGAGSIDSWLREKA